jgi:hypothetical protein
VGSALNVGDETKVNTTLRVICLVLGVLLCGAFAVGVWTTTISLDQANANDSIDGLQKDVTQLKAERTEILTSLQDIRADVRWLKHDREKSK